MSSAAMRAPTAPEDGPSADRDFAAGISGGANFTRPHEGPGFAPGWLQQLGRATASSQVCIFANDEPAAHDALRGSLFAEWLAPDAPTETLRDAFHVGECARWVSLLSDGVSVIGVAADLPPSERPLLENQGCVIVAIVPVFVEARWWGFIVLSDRVGARRRSRAEMNGLLAAAGMHGGALAQQAIQARCEATRELALVVERRRASAQLELTTTRYCRLVAATLEGVLIHDGAHILDANPSLASMVGLTVDDLIGRNPFDFIHPDFVALVR